MGSSKNNNSQNIPPGPRTIPILGNLHIMDWKRPYKSMIKLSKEYGPVFHLQMGCQEMVVLTGYETVKEALVNKAEAFAERPIVPVFEDYAKGFGIAFAHGENWRQMQRFSISALQDFGMGKRIVEDRIPEECSILTKAFETYEGKPFDPATILRAAAANIIVSFLLGKRFEYEDATLLRLVELIEENVHLAGTPAVLVYNVFPKLGFLLGARRKIMNNQKEFHDFIWATFLENLKQSDENNQRTFIDAFLVRQKEGKSKKKLQERLEFVPTNVPRATTKDITFKGFFIPKGVYILPLLTSVLHDESQWEKSHEFYPEHFLDSEGKFVKRDAFMPFSAGQRVCAGETIAKMELFLFFTNLLQRFAFQPPSGTSKDDLDLTPVLGFTTHPMPYKTCAVLSRSGKKKQKS
ncbi:cytochrome P450 2K6-like [Erythrolamprus reginae]|uniref:cytochrome P450 2K6-like n=1 Tax=Erythrolamprus reginae TaxID=121349 RepID=UPI00396CCCBC